MQVTLDDKFVSEHSNGLKEKELKVFAYDFSPYTLQIKQVDRLYQFTHITELSLIGHFLKDIGNITALTKLRKINLSWNRLIDILPLTRLTELEHISLNHNNVNTIPISISALSKLKFFSLRLNPLSDIKDINRLQDNKALHHLDIEGTPISRDNENILYVISTLPQLYVLNRQEISKELRADSFSRFGNNISTTTSTVLYEDQQKYIKQLNNTIDDLKIEKRVAEEQCEILKRSLQRHNDVINDYQNQSILLKKERQRSESLETRVKDLETTILNGRTETELPKSTISYSDSSDDEENAETLKSSLRSKREKLNSARSKIKELEAINLKDKKENKERMRLALLEIESLKSQLTQYNTFQTDSVNTLNSIEKTHSDTEQKIFNALRKAEDENKNLIAQIQTLQTHLDTQSQELKIVLKREEKAFSATQKSRKDVSELEREIVRLKELSETQQTTLERVQNDCNNELERQKKRVKETKAKCISQLREMDSITKTAVQQSQKSEKEKSALQRKLVRLAGYYEDLKKSNNQLKDDFENLKILNNQKEEEINRTKEEKEKMGQGKKMSDHIFNQLAKKYNHLLKEFDSLTKIAGNDQKLAAKAAKQKIKIVNMTEEKENLNNELLQSKAQLKEARKEIQNLKEENEDLKKKLQSRESDVQLLMNTTVPTSNFEKLNEKLSGESAKAASLMAELAEAREQLHVSQISASKLQEIAGDRARTVADLTAENDNLRQTAADFEKVKRILSNARGVLIDRTYHTLPINEKFAKIELCFDQLMDAAILPRVGSLYTAPILSRERGGVISVEGESETSNQRMKRIMNTIRKQLQAFPSLQGSFGNDPDSIELQLEQLSKIIIALKNLFDEREKHIAEMNSLVASQHQAVMAMNASSMSQSEANVRAARSIVDAEKSMKIDL